MKWPSVSLGTEATVLAGQSPPGVSITESPSRYPFHQGTRDFGRIYPTDRTYVDEAPRIASAGDVLLSVRAPVGRVNLAQKTTAIGRGLMALRGGPQLDTNYLFYYLESLSKVWTQFESGGSVFSNLGKADLAKIPVPLPPIDEQQAITATLGALDDKIESNRRLVGLIPKLIRAIVSDSLNSDPREVSVADLATFVNGGAYTKDASGTGRIVIRIAELNSGPGGSTVYSDIDVPDDKTARPGDLLMSWSGSLDVYRWVFDEAIINQHIFKVLPSEGYPSWLVFDRLDVVMPIFQGIAKDKATTMGHIQRGHLELTTLEVPSSDAIRLLDELIAPLWERLLLVEREVVKLTVLRDTLLPELLSGRIRVPKPKGQCYDRP